ncbi:MAG: DUF6624 domain-containing protein [bacterium]
MLTRTIATLVLLAAICIGSYPEATAAGDSDTAHTPLDSTISDTSALSTQAADSVIVASPRMVVSIGRLEINTGVLDDTLSVFLESFGQHVAGFDFRFGLYSHLIDIVEVLPGEIYDSCRWEFFSAKTAVNSGHEGYPTSLWHAVALAETVPDQTRPVCFGFDRKASLLRLVVQSAPTELIDDTTVALFFLWEDCGDNTVADASGQNLLISSQVVDYFSDDRPVSQAMFPTRTGAPNPCSPPDAQNPPTRAVEFRNGGIEFRLDLAAVNRRESMREALEGMLATDQGGRLALDSLEQIYEWDSPEIQDAWSRQHEADSLNQQRLDSIVDLHGWPQASEVGSEAAMAAFLIVQHSNLGCMQKYLPAIRRQFNLGEIPGQHLALLEDRVLMLQDLPQIYGSQIVFDEATGEMRPHEIAAPQAVDSLRAVMGMQPLAEYLKLFGIENWTPAADSGK